MAGNFNPARARPAAVPPASGIRPDTRPDNGTITKVNALHIDGLGSVRAVTDATGLAVERTTYRPYGEEVAQLQPLSLPETKGFIPLSVFDPVKALPRRRARGTTTPRACNTSTRGITTPSSGCSFIPTGGRSCRRASGRIGIATASMIR